MKQRSPRSFSLARDDKMSISLEQELKEIFSGEIESDSNTLARYSGDASIFRITPQLVVHPNSVEDIKILVKFVSERKKTYPDLSLTARAAGSDMTGGPLNESIILDVTAHLNQIEEISSNHVIAQPGIYFRDLEKKLNQKDLMFPSYPASKSIAALGGIVANNAGGEKSLKFGQTVDYVESLKMVLADGEEYEFEEISERKLNKKIKQKNFEGQIYKKAWNLIKDNYDLIDQAKPKVSKNSTGYLLWDVWNPKTKKFNLAKLFVGSQGTLGIITEIKLRVIPKEKLSKMVVIYLNQINQISHLVSKILDFKPTSIESYDDKTLKLALRLAPQLARLIGEETNLLTLAWQLIPDAKIVLTSGLPKLVLMVEFTGNELDQIDLQIERLTKYLLDSDLHYVVAHSEQQAEKYWVIRRQSFNLLRKKVTGKQTVPFIDDFIIPPEKMSEFLPKLSAILDDYKSLTFTIAGHAGNGNFHIIPLMDMTKEENRKIIPEVSKKVYELVLQYNGSISAEHNEGLIRGPYIKQMYGEKMFQIFKEVKKIFDPQNIFNPHKKTDAELSYSMAHLKQDNQHEV